MPNLGRYEIIEQVGQGSMGTVYKARDPILGRDVAIKRILVQPGEHSEAVEFRERFLREARAAGKLSHPGIVTVFDVSEHEGTPFLVMEYVPSRTLLSILQNDERMSIERACEVGIQLADALDYAHRNGVIHRDIKPANILVTYDGRIKIADFGVAKLIESQLTARGQLLGTPAFMAPEQFIGMPIDARSDLFSAGVVIYCMTTGEKPFAGDTLVGVQYKVMHTEPVEPRKLNPAVSPQLNALILKAIQKDPLQRYRSGQELARDLRQCITGEPVSETSGNHPVYEPTLRITPRPNGEHSRPRINVALTALIAFLLAFLAVASVYFVRNLRGKEVPLADTGRPVVAAVAQSAAPEVASAGSEPEVNGGVATQNSKAVTKPRVSPAAKPAPAKLAPPQEEPRIANVVVAPPQPTPPPVEQSAVKEVNAPAPAPAPVETTASYKSSLLLIASVAVPEAFTIIVNVDNEPFYSRSATSVANFPLDDKSGKFQLQSLQSLPSIPLSEERPLPPGKHKVQVNVFARTRSISFQDHAEVDLRNRIRTLDLPTQVFKINHESFDPLNRGFGIRFGALELRGGVFGSGLEPSIG